MSQMLWNRLSLAVIAIVLLGTAAPVCAQNEGQEDLDSAFAAKLGAGSLSDLSEVVRQCESALEKGLDEGNAEFANQLLAATLVQRGSIIGQSIFEQTTPNPQWPQFRTVALKDLERGVELDPHQPLAFYLIARLNLLPRGDADRAKEAVERAIEASEDDPRILAQALTLRAGTQEKFEDALEDLGRAIELAPSEVEAFRARATVYTRQEEFDKAIADLEKALETEPEHLATHEAIALILIEQKKYGRAIKIFDRLAELAPESPAPLVQKARVLAIQEKMEPALKLLDKAHEMAPDAIGVLVLRAGIYQEMGDNAKALEDIDSVLELQPELDAAKRMRVLLLAGKGDMQLAIDQLKELSAAAPDNIDISLQMAAFYVMEGKYDDALEVYNEILEKHPGNADCLRGRADAFLGIGKHKEAIADYELALKSDPDHSGVLNNLAWVLATSPLDELRDGLRAIELATRACDVTDYEAPHILSTLAAAYAETGDFDTAIKWSTKAVELGDDNVQEALEDELKSYQEKKPWRELEGESDSDSDSDATVEEEEDAEEE